MRGQILLNCRGIWMGRHAATGRLHQFADTVGIRIARTFPHMLRHFVTTVLDVGVDLRDVPDRRASRRPTVLQCATPERARQNLERHCNYILAALMASGT